MRGFKITDNRYTLIIHLTLTVRFLATPVSELSINFLKDFVQKGR